MKLYYDQTANCYKTCAVAKYLDLPVEYIQVNLGAGKHKTPEFMKMNPNGKVPVLETDNGTLWESTAIMCYFAQKAQSDLWPNDDRQAEILRWISWDMDVFLPTAGVYYYENIIKPKYNLGQPDQEAINQVEKTFYQHATVLDNYLENKQYLVNNDLTLADFSVAVLLPYANQAGIPLRAFPNIQRWHDNLMTLSAWQKPFPTHNKEI